MVPCDKRHAQEVRPWFLGCFLKLSHAIFSGKPSCMVIPSPPLHTGNVHCVSRIDVGNAGSALGQIFLQRVCRPLGVTAHTSASII